MSLTRTYGGLLGLHQITKLPVSKMSVSDLMHGRVALAMVLMLCLASVTSVADDIEHDDSVEFQEGLHYHEISPAVATNVEPGAIEVLELFWYGCPHCYEFEKHLESWKQDKPSNITFVRMPVVLNRGWLSHARAYYALEKIGVLERIHPIFFDAIHLQGRRLRDVESMIRFLSQHEVNVDEFKEAYASPYVEKKIKSSEQLARQYRASSVPTVIVHGKYRTTAGNAGGYKQLFQLVNWLAQQE